MGHIRKFTTLSVWSYYTFLRCAPNSVFPWKGVWGSKVPHKVAVLVWTAALNFILRIDNLVKQKLLVDGCVMAIVKQQSTSCCIALQLDNCDLLHLWLQSIALYDPHGKRGITRLLRTKTNLCKKDRIAFSDFFLNILLRLGGCLAVLLLILKT